MNKRLLTAGHVPGRNRFRAADGRYELRLLTLLAALGVILALNAVVISHAGDSAALPWARMHQDLVQVVFGYRP